MARPLARAPIAAGVGYVAGKTIGGYAGSGLAMRHNQADQREYNLKHPVTKYAENMTVAERRKMSRKKRIAALSSTTTGVLGLGALGALALKRPKLQTGLLTSGAAISGANNLNFAGVLRREAKAQDPDKHVKKMAPRIVYHGTNKEAARTIRYTGKLRAGRSSQRNEVYVSPHKKIAAAYAGRRVAGKNEATDEARRILAERKQQHGGPGHVVRMWAVGPSSEPEHRGAVRAFAGSAYHPNNVHVATTRTVPTLSRLAEDTNRKSFGVPVVKADVKHMAWHSGGSACGMISAPKHRLTTQWSRVTCHGCRKARWLFGKADRREPLSRMRADQAAQIVRRHGDAGPLPSNLSRPERMQAYEARYVHAGGHKAEHWQRRADRADKVKVAGLAGATAGGAAIMALRHPRLAARLGHRAHAARHAADTATIGAATVSGAGELYAGHARRRRASYSNSKAGVAASALRRMRDYAA